MRLYERIRLYIKSNGLRFNHVADRAGIGRKRFYRLISGYSSMSVEDYEKICRLGLGVHPKIFFENNFSENEKKTA